MITLEPMLSVGSAARLLKVSPSTVQRLCNRGVVRFQYTSGGHRRIPSGELHKLAEALGCEVHQGPVPTQRGRDMDDSRIVDCLLGGATDELLQWLLSARAQPRQLLAKLERQLYGAVIDLDRRFLEQGLEKHAVCLAINTAQAVLERLSAQLSVTCPKASVAIGGSICGSHSSLSVLFAEVALRLCDIDAIGLSGPLPARALAESVEHLQARMVWVSHAHLTSVTAAIQWHRDLQRYLPSDVRVLVGGGALSPSVLGQLPPHTHYRSLLEMFDAERRRDNPVAASGILG